MKDQVYTLPMPTTLYNSNNQLKTARAYNEQPLLSNVWNGLKYSLMYAGQQMELILNLYRIGKNALNCLTHTCAPKQTCVHVHTQTHTYIMAAGTV